MKRLVINRFEPVIDPKLPAKQAGFRYGHYSVVTIDQIVKLINDIEESFERGEKAGVLLVDLTAAYDTLWIQGLVFKLLNKIPDKHLGALPGQHTSKPYFCAKIKRWTI